MIKWLVCVYFAISLSKCEDVATEINIITTLPNDIMFSYLDTVQKSLEKRMMLFSPYLIKLDDGQTLYFYKAKRHRRTKLEFERIGFTGDYKKEQPILLVDNQGGGTPSPYKACVFGQTYGLDNKVNISLAYLHTHSGKRTVSLSPELDKGDIVYVRPLQHEEKSQTTIVPHGTRIEIKLVLRSNHDSILSNLSQLLIELSFEENENNRQMILLDDDQTPHFYIVEKLESRNTELVIKTILFFGNESPFNKDVLWLVHNQGGGAESVVSICEKSTVATLNNQVTLTFYDVAISDETVRLLPEFNKGDLVCIPPKLPVTQAIKRVAPKLSSHYEIKLALWSLYDPISSYLSEILGEMVYGYTYNVTQLIVLHDGQTAHVYRVKPQETENEGLIIEEISFFGDKCLVETPILWLMHGEGEVGDNSRIVWCERSKLITLENQKSLVFYLYPHKLDINFDPVVYVPSNNESSRSAPRSQIQRAATEWQASQYKPIFHILVKSRVVNNIVLHYMNQVLGKLKNQIDLGETCLLMFNEGQTPHFYKVEETTVTELKFEEIAYYGEWKQTEAPRFYGEWKQAEAPPILWLVDNKGKGISSSADYMEKSKKISLSPMDDTILLTLYYRATPEKKNKLIIPKDVAKGSIVYVPAASKRSAVRMSEHRSFASVPKHISVTLQAKPLSVDPRPKHQSIPRKSNQNVISVRRPRPKIGEEMLRSLKTKRKDNVVMTPDLLSALQEEWLLIR